MSGILTPEQRRAVLAREQRLHAAGSSLAAWFAIVTILLLGVAGVLLALAAMLWAGHLLARVAGA